MTFNDNVQLDTSNVGGGGGGGRGGMVVGGGIGGLILLLLSMLFGNIGGGGDTTSSGAQGAGSGNTAVQERCRTGADANKYVECRIVATENSANAYWSQVFKSANRQYQRPGLVIFSNSVQSACGTASSQTGPFYCPTDQKIYIDASFFEVLSQRFGSSRGALAQEYVVAHEFGHHIQNELNLLGYSQQDPQGAESGAVRVELMADCLAGVWANNASKTQDANGNTFLKPLTDTDIKDALSAAAAVGDDRIQQSTQGRTNPESYTHGTSAQRQKWFITGYQSGSINQCNTLRSANLG